MQPLEYSCYELGHTWYMFWKFIFRENEKLDRFSNMKQIFH